MSAKRPGPAPGRVAAEPVRGRASLRTIAAASLIGNLIEIYDFILYSFVAALVFGPLFFPGAEPWLGTLYAISSQAVAFVVRPVGAVLFGRIGDRFGRRTGLILTLGMMGLATVLLGLLPPYSAIGAAAPVLLVVLRIMQGLAYGGEWGGAILIAVEHAPAHRKTLYGAIPQVGATLGIGLAAGSLWLLGTVVSPATFRLWGWRIPFLVGAVLIAVGVVIRTRIEETPEFRAARARSHSTVRRAGLSATLCEGGRPILAMILNWQAAAVAVLTFATGLLAFVPRHVPGLDAADVQIGMLIATVVVAPVTVGAAWLGGRLGRERVLLIAGVFTIVWAFPGYWLIGSGHPALLWLAMTVGLVNYGLTNGVIGATMSEHFPVRLRYTGLSIAFAVASVLGGAVLPIPALAWSERLGGSTLPLALVFLVGGLCTVGGALWTKRLPKFGECTPS
ncbi:MFS transporter [Amycolatopsis thermoflava]|uniref:MFS transporter n=1 Tax=Amycolatopsis thermoflava TaxID=84480 RepID=UPI0037F8C80B